MKFKSVILTIILGFFYPFSLLFKVHRNRITFISLEHANLSKDFKLLYDRLEKESKYEIRTVLFKFEPNIWGNLRYGLACIHQLFLIQSSRLVIIDFNNFVVSRFPHRKDVKVLQIWHATGALKHFGNDVERDYIIKNYDYAIANSDFFKPIYSKAFNLPEESVKTTGIPDNDKNFDQEYIRITRERLWKKYPSLAGKKVVTYAPTFRGRISTQFKEAKIDLDAIHNELGDNYIILFKAHPLIEHSKYEANANVLFIKKESISSIFCITDILVTDYSALTIDWMVFDKPTIAYVPDIRKYSNKPGLTINYYNEFPGQVVRNEKDLIDAIKNSSSQNERLKRQLFIKKMYKFRDGKSTDRVIDLISKIMSGEQINNIGEI